LENTLVIQNPVNLPFYEQLDLPESKDGYVDLALVGRLTVGDKGQDIVISMMAEKEWLTRKIRIHIYGKGQDLDYIRSLIAFYQVEEKVIIEGQAPIEDIWRKCQALLMPSIIEGTPLTLLEAMVLGRVCIVTRVGGNDEWVVDGRNGFLAEAPTQELLSNKLREAMDNLDKWPDIAGRAHRDAMAKLDRNPGKTLMAQIIS
jgi:glycosyltransferase involved in cell wall biosynthesis